MSVGSKYLGALKNPFYLLCLVPVLLGKGFRLLCFSCLWPGCIKDVRSLGKELLVSSSINSLPLKMVNKGCPTSQIQGCSSSPLGKPRAPKFPWHC